MPCQTKCGLRLYGWSGDCRGLQAAEDRAVEVYSERFQSVCDKLKDWNVFVQPPGYEKKGWGSSAHDGGVLGLTFCDKKEMQIETDHWKKSSLSHEIRHVLTWCDHEHPDAGEDPHAGWEDGGLPWVPEEIDRAAGLRQ